MRFFKMFQSIYPPGVKNQLKIPSFAKITTKIRLNEIITVVTGPTLTPIELSSKKRIKPAPPIGIGAFPALRFLLLD
jgi:hypothetical protein